MYKKPKSDYVCAHCGVTLRFQNFDWKHAANRFVKACGQPAQPEPRILYELRQQNDKAARA